jgi:phospholipid/cholesterol/gamma-HCH transport system substrate-binding protein
MKISRRRLFKLGLFVAAGLVILIVAVYYLGKQQNIFGSGVNVYAEFSNIKGLQIGNNVRFLGTNAGYVSGITVKNDSTIVVQVVILSNMSRYIRKNSMVEIMNDGIMGSKILEIYPGTGDFQPIENGNFLPSRTTLSMEELFRSLEGTVEYSTRASQNLWLVTENIIKGEGILGMLLTDAQMTRKLEEITSSLVMISQEGQMIMQKVNSPASDMGKLLNEDHLTRQAQKALSELDSLLKTLQLSAAEIQAASAALNRGDGLVQKLLHDPALAASTDSTLLNLNMTLESVTETSETLKRSWIFNLFRKR